MKKLLFKNENFSLYQITGENELNKIVKFVLSVNYRYHLNQDFPLEELRTLLRQDMLSLNHSVFYVIYDNVGGIVGTIKSQKWDKKIKLCVEKDFDIDLQHLIKILPDQPEEVFHIGRFAIDQERIRKDVALRKNRITIFKMLLIHALSPVCQGDGSKIALCECDEKLYLGLQRLGLDVKPIGTSKVYMGSNTVPLYSNNMGIQSFMNKNYHLCYV